MADELTCILNGRAHLKDRDAGEVVEKLPIDNAP
jgi:hypothetical protein